MANYTQAQLDALRAAIATGALTVQYADRKVEYRTLDEMERLLAIMTGDLGQSTNKSRFSLAAFRKQS